MQKYEHTLNEKCEITRHKVEMHERVLKQVHERLTDACRCMVSSNPRTKFTKFGEHLSIGQMPKSQIPLRYPARELLRSRFEAGRGPVAKLLARASSLLAG